MIAIAIGTAQPSSSGKASRASTPRSSRGSARSPQARSSSRTAIAIDDLATGGEHASHLVVGYSDHVGRRRWRLLVDPYAPLTTEVLGKPRDRRGAFSCPD